MILKVALLISMLIQLCASIIAVSLIRKTRYNISWILISSGFVLMAVRRVYDFSFLSGDIDIIPKNEFNSWLAVLISVLMFVGVLFVNQIFKLQDQLNKIRDENESRDLHAVIQGEENARRKIARDLHDGLGPVLSSIKMLLSAVELEKIEQSNKKIIQRSSQITDEAIVSLKEISNNLSPYTLENVGMIKSIEMIIDQYMEGSKIQFNLDTNIASSRYPRNVEINVYRIVCELINNSIRHASPNRISLQIQDEQGAILIAYKDDGCGFDYGSSISRNELSGMGLNNIFSRIKLLQADYSLLTAPGEGFSIKINVPL